MPMLRKYVIYGLIMKCQNLNFVGIIENVNIGVATVQLFEGISPKYIVISIRNWCGNERIPVTIDLFNSLGPSDAYMR